MVAERVGVRWTRRLLNTCMREGIISEEWRTGLIVSVWPALPVSSSHGEDIGLGFGRRERNHSTSFNKI